jgi:hypothetical protein
MVRTPIATAGSNNEYVQPSTSNKIPKSNVERTGIISKTETNKIRKEKLARKQTNEPSNDDDYVTLQPDDLSRQQNVVSNSNLDYVRFETGFHQEMPPAPPNSKSSSDSEDNEVQPAPQVKVGHWMKIQRGYKQSLPRGSLQSHDCNKIRGSNDVQENVVNYNPDGGHGSKSGFLNPRKGLSNSMTVVSLKIRRGTEGDGKYEVKNNNAKEDESQKQDQAEDKCETGKSKGKDDDESNRYCFCNNSFVADSSDTEGSELDGDFSLESSEEDEDTDEEIEPECCVHPWNSKSNNSDVSFMAKIKPGKKLDQPLSKRAKAERIWKNLMWTMRYIRKARAAYRTPPTDGPAVCTCGADEELDPSRKSVFLATRWEIEDALDPTLNLLPRLIGLVLINGVYGYIASTNLYRGIERMGTRYITSESNEICSGNPGPTSETVNHGTVDKPARKRRQRKKNTMRKGEVFRT